MRAVAEPRQGAITVHAQNAVAWREVMHFEPSVEGLSLPLNHFSMLTAFPLDMVDREESNSRFPAASAARTTIAFHNELLE